jgi:hypothetical protein
VRAVRGQRGIQGCPATGSAYVKDGGLAAAWVHESDNIRQITLS